MKKIRVGWCIDTLVDDEDYEYLSQWKWRLDPDEYAVRGECIAGVYRTIRMSRVILEKKNLATMILKSLNMLTRIR